MSWSVLPFLTQSVTNSPAFYATYFHKSQLFVSILSQFNSFHDLKSFNTHLSVILPSTPRSSKRSVSIRFSHQSPFYISPFHQTSHTPYSRSPTSFDNPINTWRRVQIMKFLVKQYPPAS